MHKGPEKQQAERLEEIQSKERAEKQIIVNEEEELEELREERDRASKNAELYGESRARAAGIQEQIDWLKVQKESDEFKLNELEVEKRKLEALMHEHSEK